MAQPNTLPPFPKVANNSRSVLLTTAAADYTGVSIYNREVFAAEATCGSICKSLMFKARGTNVASLARIYINNGSINTNWATAPAAPTGTPSTTGGTINASAHYATIIAIGPKGSQSVIGTYSALVTTTGNTGSIAWAWAAVPGAVSYRIYISPVTGFACRFFTSVTNSYNQTLPLEEGIYDDPNTGNQFLYKEVSLPVTTASNAIATVDLEVPMNLTLPPGKEIYVGLGTTVVSGWQVSSIGGDFA